jgi:hypothetical protein
MSREKGGRMHSEEREETSSKLEMIKKNQKG